VAPNPDLVRGNTGVGVEVAVDVAVDGTSTVTDVGTRDTRGTRRLETRTGRK
jgi:hypothetical protein